MNRILRFGIFALLLLNGLSLWSQQPNSPLDSLFSTLYANGQLNGNILLAEHGKTVYQKSFGYSDFASKRPNSPDNGFTLASISKIFTSSAILQLAERGKLKLDDPVQKHLVGFPFPKISLRHLLSHTSGLPDYELFESQLQNDTAKIINNTAIIPALCNWGKKLAFAPGERWKYSNINYCLLAMVIEKCSGLSFKAYLKRYIFLPAGMKNTYFLGETSNANFQHLAKNHDYKDIFSFSPENTDYIARFHWRLYNLKGLEGQGTVISTTSDMLNFDRALNNGKLLGANSLTLAFSPFRLNDGSFAQASIGIGKGSFGLGWFILEDIFLGKMVYHTGGLPGAVTILLRNLDKKQLVAIFDNQFSTGIYKNAMNAMLLLNNKKPIVVKQSITSAVARALAQSGTEAGFAKFLELKADSANFSFSEDDLNELGLRLLYQAKFAGHEQMALEVMRMNILLFPNGYNTYDSYGEALAFLGKKEQAIIMYRKSITLNPKNISGIEALKKLLIP